MNSLICALMYILLLAASTVFVEKLSVSINVNLLNFAVTVVAFFSVNLVNLPRCRYAYSSIKNDTVLWMVMSVFLAGSWIFSYFSTVSSSADFSMAVIFLTMGAGASLHKKQWVKLVMCFLSIVLCYLFADKACWLALLYAFFSGGTLYAYAYYSKHFAKKNALTPLDILSVRFFPLLIIACVLMLLFTPPEEFMHVSGRAWFYVLLLGFSNRVLPMFFFQFAIHGLPTEQLAFLTSFIPLVTYILLGVVDHQFPAGLFFAVLISTVSLNIHRFSIRKKTNRLHS